MSVGSIRWFAALSTLGLTLAGGCVDLNLDWVPPSQGGSSSEATAGDSDSSTSAGATTGGSTSGGLTTAGSAGQTGSSGDTTETSAAANSATGLESNTEGETWGETWGESGGETEGEAEEILYDFWDEHCEFDWIAGVGDLYEPATCNTLSDQLGWEEKKLNQPVLAEGVAEFERALLISPPTAPEGVITGTYEPVTLEGPAAFVTHIGCRGDNEPCQVMWQVVLRYAETEEFIAISQDLESNDGEISEVVLDLSPYVGSSLSITFAAIAVNGLPSDELVWEAPRIIAL